MNNIRLAAWAVSVDAVAVGIIAVLLQTDVLTELGTYLLAAVTGSLLVSAYGLFRDSRQ